MRRDVLIGLEEAAQLDALPFGVSYADETINPEVAERFAAAFAESDPMAVALTDGLTATSLACAGTESTVH